MGRLKKGVIAPGVAARSNRAKESVAARLKVFEELQQSGVSSADVRWTRFASVDALATWEDADRGIYPISPKTMRKHIDLMHEGGYRAFILSVESIRACNKTSTARPSIETAIRQGLEREAAAILEMTNRYLDLMKRLRNLAEESPQVMAQLKHHLRIFGDEHPHLTRVK